MDNSLNGVEAVQDLLRFLQILSSTLQVLQLELYCSDRNCGVDIGILRIWIVNFVCYGEKEGQALLAIYKTLVIVPSVCGFNLPLHCEAAFKARVTSLSWLILSAKVRMKVL